MSLIDKLRVRQNQLINEATLLSEEEFNHIIKEYDSIVSNPENIDKIVETCPFEPTVTIPMQNVAIFENDMATSMFHNKLMERYGNYLCNGKEIIIKIISHVLKPKWERRVNWVQQSVTVPKHDGAVNEVEIDHLDSQLKKIQKERNELKVKLSELSFDNEVMRQELIQEFEGKLKAQKEEHQTIVENIFKELKQHHSKMIEQQTFLIDTHERQVKDLEQTWDEEKKSDTLKIEQLTKMVEAIKAVARPPPPAVGRVPKPLTALGKAPSIVKP